MEEKNVQIKTDSSSKSFDFHKVFAAIGMILVVAIIVLGGVWYFVEGQNSNFFGDEEDTIKVSTSSANTATKSATQSAPESANNSFFMPLAL